MKYLLLLLVSTSVFANRVPLSEAQRYIDAAPNGVTALYTCEQRPEEPCLDFSHIEGWDVAEIVEENGQYKLKNSDAKLTERLNKQSVLKAKLEVKKAAKEAFKNADIEGATTIAKLKAIIKLLQESQK